MDLVEKENGVPPIGPAPLSGPGDNAADLSFPALTADCSSNAPSAAAAAIRAKVVFPDPGGPYKIEL